MIELPESHVLASQLTHAFAGKTIARAVAAQSPHKFTWYTDDPASYDTLLRGRRVDSAHAYGGIVELVADGMTLTLNDGVNPRLLDADAQRPAKNQLLVDFDDGTSLVCTVAMYGGILCYPVGGDAENKYHVAAKTLPSPLTDAFDEQYFRSLINEKTVKLSTKAFLATEQRIPGLGNGVLQDILWRAKINPRVKLNAMSDAQISTLYNCVKSTLADMTALGGRDTERDLYGAFGGYKSVLSRNTVAYPCPECGGSLVREAYLGGNVYYCTGCQPRN